MSAHSTEEDVKEVYARFGLAYFEAEVLYRNLCNNYAFSRVPEDGCVARPRVEEHFARATSATLGGLLNLVADRFQPALLEQLQLTLERRNFLAHRFWFKRAHLMDTSEGCQHLIAELMEYADLFDRLDKEIVRLTDPLLRRLDVPGTALEEAMEAVLTGEDLTPSETRRKLRNEEVIVAVHAVPMAASGSTLVLESEDGMLWELCDAGLGWSSSSKVELTWERAEQFQAILPTRINPRPRYTEPWSYEILFGSSVVLVVRPGPDKRSFRWTTRGQAKSLK